MAKRIIFSDQVCQYPSRYNIDSLGGDLYQITLNPGTVSTEGTPLSASNLNAIADEVIFKLKDTATVPNAYIADISALSTYYEGLTIMFKPVNTNTTTSTINISGAGAVPIKKTDNSGNVVDLQANDLIKNKYSTMTYDGTEFLMNNPSADLAETIADITAIESRLDTDESSIASIKTETVKFAVLTGSNNTYGTSISTVTSYTSGLNIDIIPNVANTGACTLNVNGLGDKSLTYNGSPLVSGFLQQSKIYRTIYNGVSFEIQPSSSFTPASNGTVQANLIAEQATKLQTARNIALSGDITGNIDFKGDSNVTLATTLKNTGTAGTYRSVSTDAKGRVTAGTNPTTRDGYGLVDVYTKTEADSAISNGANNAVTGLTTSDFAGKVSGSVVENPNKCNYNQSSALLNPSNFVVEPSTTNYSKLMHLDNSNLVVYSADTNGSIPQQLFAFDLISIVERKYGTIPGSTTADKVTWLKNNIGSILCNWWGYGSCPSGNKAYFSWYNISSSSWTASPSSNTANSPALLNSGLNYATINSYIDTNGFVYFLVYTDASDGTTASSIYTDYIDIQITFKNIFNALMQLDQKEDTNLNNHILDNTKQVPHLGTTTNSGDAYSITTSEVINANEKFTIKFNAPSTTAPTLSINSGTAYPIKKANGNNAKLYASVYDLFWDGTNFIQLGEGGEYGTVTSGDVRSTKTFGTDNGVVTGTLVTQATAAQTITPGTTDIIKNAGIYDGDITIKGIQPSDIGGRKFKSEIVHPTDLATFTAFSNSSVSNYFISNLLDFKPSIIAVYSSNSSGGEGSMSNLLALYIDIPLDTPTILVRDVVYTTGNIEYRSYKVDGSQAYVTTSGFKIPVGTNTMDMNWIAIE